MSDQANVPAAPPAEQAQEGYLQSAYRLVSDALSGASTVAQDTAADASAAAQDTASSATTAVQDAYDSAPAVLPGSTNASTEKNQAEEQGKEEAATTKSEAERREARIEETKAAGPSTESRVGKTQQEIGTETHIPTSAGPGTTLSQDAQALEAAGAKDGKPAHVPQDYTDEPCPSAFVTGEVPADVEANGAAQEKSAAAAAGEKEVEEPQHGKSKKAGFADKLKGNAKILSGKLGRNEDKVELGKSIKRGD